MGSAPERISQWRDPAAVADEIDRQRWVAYELLYHHPSALDQLGVEEVERLGKGMAVHRWAASPDRWWRRAADSDDEVHSKLGTGRKHPDRRAT
jgi:hypothetical protein